MTTQDRTPTVQTHDGGSMPAFVASPDGGGGPGLVLLQEIFGLTDYLKSRARDLAEIGYVTVVPELYWRIGPGIVSDETNEAGLQEAFGNMSKLDVGKAVDDAIATLEHVRRMPDTGGRAGVMGFCLGGRLAYEVGINSNPDVVVSYYGAGTPDRLDDAPKLTCPVIFHYGGADTFILPEHAERVREVFSRPSAEFHMHAGAGHAFDNIRSPMFYNKAARDASWPQTVSFLRRMYPAS